MTKQLWVNKVTLLCRRLFFLVRNPVSIRPHVLSNAGYLPGDFGSGLIRLDDKPVVGNLRSDPNLGGPAKGGKLISKVAIECFEIIGQLDEGSTVNIGDDIAVIDVLHVWGLNEGRGKIFVCWVFDSAPDFDP